MENPATWGPAEKVIRQALDEDHQARLSPEPVIGLSLPRLIADALRKEGLLDERAEKPLDEEAATALDKMRDTFCILEDQLRERRVLSEGDFARLSSVFSDGCQQVRKLLQRK